MNQIGEVGQSQEIGIMYRTHEELSRRGYPFFALFVVVLQIRHFNIDSQMFELRKHREFVNVGRVEVPDALKIGRQNVEALQRLGMAQKCFVKKRNRSVEGIIKKSSRAEIQISQSRIGRKVLDEGLGCIVHGNFF